MVITARGILPGEWRRLLCRLLLWGRCLLRIGRLLCRCAISLRLLVGLLRLRLLVGRNAEPFDGREDAPVILAPVDAGIDVDALPRLEAVEQLHLVA